jgi:hypothetical protein
MAALEPLEPSFDARRGWRVLPSGAHVECWGARASVQRCGQPELRLFVPRQPGWLLVPDAYASTSTGEFWEGAVNSRHGAHWLMRRLAEHCLPCEERAQVLTHVLVGCKSPDQARSLAAGVLLLEVGAGTDTFGLDFATRPDIDTQLASAVALARRNEADKGATVRGCLDRFLPPVLVAIVAEHIDWRSLFDGRLPFRAALSDEAPSLAFLAAHFLLRAAPSPPRSGGRLFPRPTGPLARPAKP